MASSSIHLLGKRVGDETTGESCRFKVSCSSIKKGGLYFPAFTTGDHNWRIDCIRILENTDSKYLSFLLYYVGEWKDVSVNFDFGVHKMDESSSSDQWKTTSFTFAKRGDRFDLDKFVGGDELDRYLQDDYLIVICKIRVLTAVRMTTSDSGVIVLSSLTGICKIHPHVLYSKDKGISSENLTDSESETEKEVASGFVKFRVKCSHVKSLDRKSQYHDFPMFMVGGHCWGIGIYYSSSVNNVSFGIYVLSATKDLKVNIEFGLLKKNDGPCLVKWKSNTHTFPQCGTGIRFERFIEGKELKGLLQDDYFDIICNLTVLSETITSDHAVIILDSARKPRIGPTNGPSSYLCTRLNKFIQNKERADVTFEVNGEPFNAHSFVLAAQSPVFDAELFGSMDGNKKMNIKISEMKPKIFEAMLNFLYTDVLPDLTDINNGANNVSNQKDSIEMLQHLLVASNYYALERLKLICEDKLSQIITMDTVLANLVLAEKNNCPNLKAKCLEYVILPRNFGRIAVSDEYAEMIMSCPTIRDELKAKF